MNSDFYEKLELTKKKKFEFLLSTKVSVPLQIHTNIWQGKTNLPIYLYKSNNKKILKHDFNVFFFC